MKPQRNDDERGRPGESPEGRSARDAVTRRQFLIRSGGAFGGVLLGGSFLAACGSSSKSSGGTSATTAAASSGATTATTAASSSGTKSGGTFKIGVLAPTTGLLAASYGPLVFNATVAADQINAAGGILGKQIELVHQDDGGSAAMEPQAVKQLYSSGIRFLCGPIGSSQSAAALAVTTPLKMIQCSWGSDIREGYPNLHPYNFTVFPTTTQVGALFADFLVTKMGHKKIGLLLENSDYGTAIQSAAAGPLKQLGATVVATESYPVTATSFDSYIQNLKNAGAEAILGAMGNPPNILAAYQSMANLKWYPPLASNAVTLQGVLTEDKAYPTELTNNIFGYSVKPFTYAQGGAPPAATVDYIKAAEAVPGFKSVAALSGPFYDFLFMLKKGIEAAGSFDVGKVKTAMESISNYQGKVGTLSFSSTSHNGVPDGDIVPVVAQSGLATESYGGQIVERAPGY